MGRIDVNRVVIGCRDNAFVGEDETGDDGATVCREGNMFGVEVVDPFCSGKVARLEQNFVWVGARQRIRRWKSGSPSPCDQFPCERPFRVPSKPYFGALQQIPPQDVIRINDIPPGLANTRGPSKRDKRKEAQYMRGEFGGK